MAAERLTLNKLLTQSHMRIFKHTAYLHKLIGTILLAHQSIEVTRQFIKAANGIASNIIVRNVIEITCGLFF